MKMMLNAMAMTSRPLAGLLLLGLLAAGRWFPSVFGTPRGVVIHQERRRRADEQPAR
jgi:hypothetical protein